MINDRKAELFISIQKNCASLKLKVFTRQKFEHAFIGFKPLNLGKKLLVPLIRVKDSLFGKLKKYAQPLKIE